MNNSIHTDFFKLLFQGGMNSLGRLATHASAYVKPLFSSRPEMEGKKGGLNPHGYWLQVALPNTTSLRTFRLLGRHASGRLRMIKNVIPQTWALQDNHQRNNRIRCALIRKNRVRVH
jgi:hypothetical protein